MFEIVYAKSVLKDLRKIAQHERPAIKSGIGDLKDFPDISQIKRLKNHLIAEFRFRIGNYRVLFDVDWEDNKIFILKVGHRKDVY